MWKLRLSDSDYNNNGRRSSSSKKKVGDSKEQLFWEAFPTGSGPLDYTTYMFTYVEPQPGSPKLEELFKEYWDLMPEYQDVSLDNLEILRVIYEIFPTYRESPLLASFNRVLQFGDASDIHSPVSFGGFGSLTKHLGRLSARINEAINVDNQAAITISNNPVFQGKIKHFKIEYYFLREVQSNKEAILVHCKTEDQLADILTKALPKHKFKELRDKIGVCIKRSKEKY